MQGAPRPWRRGRSAPSGVNVDVDEANEAVNGVISVWAGYDED